MVWCEPSSSQLSNLIQKGEQASRVLVVGADETTLERLSCKCVKFNQTQKVILDKGVSNQMEVLVTQKNDLLSEVEYLAQTLEYTTFQEYNCQRAQLFFENHLTPLWANFESQTSHDGSLKVEN